MPSCPPSAPLLSLSESVVGAYNSPPHKEEERLFTSGSCSDIPECLTSTFICSISSTVLPGMLPRALINKKCRKIYTVDKECRHSTLCVPTGNPTFRFDRPHKHFTSASPSHNVPYGVPHCCTTGGHTSSSRSYFHLSLLRKRTDKCCGHQLRCSGQ